MTKSAFSKIKSFFERKENEKVGIIACNIINDIEYKKQYANVKTQKTVDFIACGAAIRKKVYMDVGGFNEKLFIYGEETDFSYRCIAKGYTIVYIPNILVAHPPSKSPIIDSFLIGARNKIWVDYTFLPYSLFVCSFLKDLVLNSYKSIRSMGCGTELI